MKFEKANVKKFFNKKTSKNDPGIIPEDLLKSYYLYFSKRKKIKNNAVNTYCTGNSSKKKKSDTKYKFRFSFYRFFVFSFSVFVFVFVFVQKNWERIEFGCKLICQN